MIDAGVKIPNPGENPIKELLVSAGINHMVGGKINDAIKQNATRTDKCGSAIKDLSLVGKILGPALVAQNAWDRFKAQALRLCPELPTEEKQKLEKRILHWRDNMKTLEEAFQEAKVSVQKKCGVDFTEKQNDLSDYSWKGRKSSGH